MDNTGDEGLFSSISESLSETLSEMVSQQHLQTDFNEFVEVSSFLFNQSFMVKEKLLTLNWQRVGKSAFFGQETIVLLIVVQYIFTCFLIYNHSHIYT